jgi:hypothetical protein
MDRHNDGTGSSSDSDVSSSTLKQMAACKTCKEKHRRCDGLAPCGSCIKHGVECEPSQRPSRKGPTRGELKDLRESVGQLQQDLETERQKYIDLQEKFALLRQNKAEFEDISLSGHLSTTHALDITLRRYNEHVMPWYQVSIPFKDFQFLRDKKEIDEPRTLLTYACLLAGSTMGGDSRQTAELFQRVRNGLSRMYDKTDPYICAVYMMLSRIYILFTDNDKGAMCNTTALHMSERLMERLKVQEVCGVNLEVVKQNCLLNCTDNNKERQIQSIKQMLAKTTLNAKAMTIQAIYVLRQVWMLISTAMRTNDKLFNSPENIRYIFSLISLVKDMADKSEIKDIMIVRLTLKVAILTFLIGMEHTSQIFVARALDKAEVVSKELHHTLFLIVVPLFMLGQVLVFKGDHANLNRVIHAIRRLIPVSQYAANIVESLSRAELDCEIPEYYESIFYQYIHRFKHTNHTYGNGIGNISESELLSIFEERPEITPHDVNVTKKARIDNHRSIPTATDTMQQAPPHMHVTRPTVVNQHPPQPMNHVRPQPPQHVTRPQYPYPSSNGHHNAPMYYNQPLPYAPQQQQQYPSHNYAAQPMIHTVPQGQGGDLNLQLDYEDVIQTGPPPQYQPSPRSDNGYSNNYHPYYPPNTK